MVDVIVFGAFSMLLGGGTFTWFVLRRGPRWMLASALVFVDAGAAVLATALIPGNARFAVAGIFGAVAVGSAVQSSRLRRQWRREGGKWTRDTAPNS
jgi:hypothetical protein